MYKSAGSLHHRSGIVFANLLTNISYYGYNIVPHEQIINSIAYLTTVASLIVSRQVKASVSSVTGSHVTTPKGYAEAGFAFRTISQSDNTTKDGNPFGNTYIGADITELGGPFIIYEDITADASVNQSGQAMPVDVVPPPPPPPGGAHADSLVSFN